MWEAWGCFEVMLVIVLLAETYQLGIGDAFAIVEYPGPIIFSLLHYSSSIIFVETVIYDNQLLVKLPFRFCFHNKR
jgi:hypothetical protein